MALLTTGKPFIKELEKVGALATYIPLEGGFEGRYIRRLRSTGYECLSLTARGLGDPAAYLTDVHGVRPAHLGKKTTSSSAAVGDIYYIPPSASYRLESLAPKMKGLVLWILEGYVLSRQEIQYLSTLPQIEPRLKVVVEMGGARSFRWLPLADTLD